MKQIHTTILVFLIALSSGTQVAISADVPASLPKPDDATPATDKPVKVYVLAGQSNMVGFGKKKGAKTVYPSIYFSADPRTIPCRMPTGDSALLPHGIYQSEAPDAPNGALVVTYDSNGNPIDKTTVALGSTDADLPSITREQTLVAKAFIEVPMSGTYEIHVGHGDSSYATSTLDGKEAYRRDSGKKPVLTEVELIQGERYPIEITYTKGGSAVFWLKRDNIPGKGDLTQLIKQGKFTWLGSADEGDYEADWTERNDVTYWEVRISKAEIGEGGPLSPDSNVPGGKFLGPEIPFGYVMGTYHEEPVLLIESSMGNRSLNFDFRPPSSGRNEPDNHYEGYEYRHMIKGVRQTLDNIESIVPNYHGQGYEIAGFVWWQGHKDRGVSKKEYEEHLIHLIQDVRKDLNTPEMPAVVATVGFDGEDMIPEYREIHAAQMAVSDPAQHPEFSKNVRTIDTIPYWRARGESPSGVDFHYNFNSETYTLTGDAMGRAMVELQGGTAEEIAMPPEAPMHPDVKRIYSEAIERIYDDRDREKYNTRSENPTPEEYAKMASLLRPMVLDEMIPDYIETAFSDESRRLRDGIELKDILKGKQFTRFPEDIQSQLDALIALYNSVGIYDYQWRRFGPAKKTSQWYYHSFDPPEKQDIGKTYRYREITFPEGMENWNQPNFDPIKAGWELGQAPFGQRDGKLESRSDSCYQPLCDCDKKPNTFWEKEVLLMTQTFEMPPAKEGHAYRVLLGGAGCDRSGEGYAVYVNGKLLAQQKGGFMFKEGVRGAYFFDDVLPEFDGGEVTISVLNFLRYTFHRNRLEYQGTPVPPNGQVSLWIEEAKIPLNALLKAKE